MDLLVAMIPPTDATAKNANNAKMTHKLIVRPMKGIFIFDRNLSERLRRHSPFLM
jgi:hypothetical protein